MSTATPLLSRLPLTRVVSVPLACVFLAGRAGQAAELRKADLLLWLGDFNYRLNTTMSHEEVVSSLQLLGREGVAALRPLDQLTQEQIKGSAMADMQASVPLPRSLACCQPHQAWTP